MKAGKDASWLIGGAFHYGQSDMDGTADAAGGSADVDQYTFKVYATYMKDNGAFVDLVLHTGYYDTELTGLANNKMAGFKADYSNWGYGVSAEVGHRFEFGESASAWYVEPTARSRGSMPKAWNHVSCAVGFDVGARRFTELEPVADFAETP